MKIQEKVESKAKGFVRRSKGETSVLSFQLTPFSSFKRSFSRLETSRFEISLLHVIKCAKIRTKSALCVNEYFMLSLEQYINSVPRDQEVVTQVSSKQLR